MSRVIFLTIVGGLPIRPVLAPGDWCEECGGNPCECSAIDPGASAYSSDDDSYPPPCTDPGGHEFSCTGTDYGGDDARWHGEGRCLCIHCGADGDA